MATKKTAPRLCRCMHRRCRAKWCKHRLPHEKTDDTYKGEVCTSWGECYEKGTHVRCVIVKTSKKRKAP